MELTPAPTSSSPLVEFCNLPMEVVFIVPTWPRKVSEEPVKHYKVDDTIIISEFGHRLNMVMCRLVECIVVNEPLNEEMGTWFYRGELGFPDDLSPVQGKSHIFVDTKARLWFCDETQIDICGPFPTLVLCEAALTKYAASI